MRTLTPPPFHTHTHAHVCRKFLLDFFSWNQLGGQNSPVKGETALAAVSGAKPERHLYLCWSCGNRCGVSRERSTKHAREQERRRGAETGLPASPRKPSGREQRVGEGQKKKKKNLSRRQVKQIFPLVEAKFC